MAQPSRTLSARGLITYPDTSTDSLTSAEIVSLVVHENAGEHLPLGGVSASTLTLKLDNRQGEWNAKNFDGAIINLEIGVYHPSYSATPLTVDGDSPGTVYTESADGGAPDTVYTDTIDGGAPETFPAETYWAKIGTFVTESAIGQEQSTTIEIKGADYLGNYAQKEFTDGQTYSRTVLQILQYACSQAGITLDTTTFVNSTQSIATKPVWEPGTTCRDIIGYVACLAAGFARIDRDGLLEIVEFDDTPDYTITTARYKNFERQGSIFGPFNALSVYEHGAPNNYGATRIADDIDMVDNELNSIAVQGNPLLKYGSSSTLMTNMLSALSGLTFTGAKIDWQGDPSLTNGDAVTLTDLDSVAVVVLILNQTLTLDSGFSMSSGNSLKSVIKGKAKAEYMRVFTPTGKLNAAALDGDINIRAGRRLNLIGMEQIVLTSGTTLGDLLSASGNVTYTGATAPASPNTGDLWFDTGNYNVCKRWSGSAWTEYTQGKLSNSKMTLDATGISLLAAGTFTVASGNFMIDASGNVAMKGSVTSTSGVIGGFTIGATSLSASPSGKPVMTLDTANSQFKLGDLTIYYNGTFSASEFNVGTGKMLMTTSDFMVGQTSVLFEVEDGAAWCNGNMSALSFTDRP